VGLRRRHRDGVRARRPCGESEGRGSERIAIELDGNIHYNPIAQQADFERDEWLKSKEITVLRFENYMVRQQMDNVLLAIQGAFR
jgi:very-short-patch-repair endonuclease